MRTIFFKPLAAIMMTVLILTGAKCSKPPSPPEQDLRVSVDAAAIEEVPGPDFNFNLMVESAMPAAGVRITFSVKGEADNRNYPQGPFIETTNNTTRISLINLPRQKFCICTVTVVSISTTTNTATADFRIIYK
jgi:preprotein translocase subunit Sec63